MNKLIISFFFICFSLFANCQIQQTDSAIAASIFGKALTDDWAINNLEYLVTNYPKRLCGTKALSDAVIWLEKTLKEIGAENIFRQDLMVVHWDRGTQEKGYIDSKQFGKNKINVCALGNSVSTGINGITAEVVEVQNFEELHKLGKEKVKGKIVFFNRAMDPKFFYTFQAYGGAANQRTRGASEAAKYGAVAVIIRSLTLSNDTFPHTGVMRYDTNYAKIPAFCISTFHADMLSNQLKKDNKLSVYLESNCILLPEEKSCNVVGEIKGSEFPEEFIAIGGHIDCWDNSAGAHDDGAGIIHSMEVLRLFKELDIKPRHTIRIVMFMDEEMDQRGAKKYAELTEKNNEKHIAAIESDRGGASPTGFSMDVNDSIFNKVMQWQKLFYNYGFYQFIRGGSGVDIGPLKKFGTPLFAIMPDSQRYFDYHHCANDTFDKVNKRELQLGSAGIALLVYLIDKYGL